MITANEKRPAATEREQATNENSLPSLYIARNGSQPVRESSKSLVGRNGKETEGRSTADKLVDLALSRYRIGRTENDDCFAVEKDGPNVAIMFRGSKDALRSALASAYWAAHGTTPNSAALADALTTLQGKCRTAEQESVHLRVAEHEGTIVIDLGDETGRAVIVDRGSWAVVDRSPVLFRRTKATGAMPVPELGGNLEELRRLLNVSDDTWPLVLGWLLAGYISSIAHPILLLGGQQGSGKTTAAKKLVGLLDPSPVPVRSQPRDPESWAIAASASWVVALDNVSAISDWLSDSLCKACTGDGLVRRKLFTDDDISVLTFRRVLLLTSIDAGALRGDLGDRILLVDLERIDDSDRLTERQIESSYKEVQSRVFSALLDLLAQVWKELPNIQLDQLPRMADFGCVLAAMDKVRGTNALSTYSSQRERIAEVVVGSDPVALAIQALVEETGAWEGTAAELLEKITPVYPERPPKNWPRTPNVLGGRLSRLEPAFRQIGIEVLRPPRSAKSRRFTIRKAELSDSERNDDNIPF